MKIEVNFTELTAELVKKAREDYSKLPEIAPLKTIPFEDLERAINAVGGAASKLAPMNPIAFGVALHFYAECIKDIVTEAVKNEKADS